MHAESMISSRSSVQEQSSSKSINFSMHDVPEESKSCNRDVVHSSEQCLSV